MYKPEVLSIAFAIIWLITGCQPKTFASPTALPPMTALPFVEENPTLPDAKTTAPPTQDNIERSAILFRLDVSEEHFAGILLLPEKAVIELPNGFFPLSWSPSGDKLLLLNPEGGLSIANSLGENPTPLPSPPSGDLGWSW